MKTLLKSQLLYWFILFPMLILMASCGGGGGGSSSGGTASTGPDTTAPTVSISAPINNAAVSGTVAVTATASDNIGVSRVEFYVNNSLQATVSTVPYTFNWDTTKVGSGSCTLSAKAYDAAGNMGASAAVAVTVDNMAPTVMSTSPANGAANIAINSSITAIFSEEMKTATLNLMNGSTTVSVNQPVFVGTTVTFTPSSNLAPNTTYSATITGVDLAGNAIVTPYQWSFTTASLPDTVPPAVSTTNPVNGATGVPVITTLSVTFSEPMTPFTFGTIDGVQGTVVWDATNTTVTFTPGSTLKANTTYTITVSGYDLAGNPMLAPYTWSFTTAP